MPTPTGSAPKTTWGGGDIILQTGKCHTNADTNRISTKNNVNLPFLGGGGGGAGGMFRVLIRIASGGYSLESPHRGGRVQMSNFLTVYSTGYNA